MNSLEIEIEKDFYIVEELDNKGEVVFAKTYDTKKFTIGQATEDYYNNIFTKN